MKGKKLLCGLAMCLLWLCGAAARAGEVPSSILVFPLYDTNEGKKTGLCVTNTNSDTTFCPDTGFRLGDVLLHYYYVDGDDWREFDRFELLTPGDTLCVFVKIHNPEGNRGFCVVSARNPVDGTLMAFDALIGSAVLAESELNLLWSYTAIGIPSGDLGVPTSCTGFVNPDTDLGDGDGAPDFNGIEYGAFPKKLFLDSFFEENGRRHLTTQLTLLSTSGPNYTNELAILIWNNIEVKYSRTFNFTCWFSGPISEISAVASHLGGNPEELRHRTQNGWIELRGNRILDNAGNPVKQADHVRNAVPAMLGVFKQVVTTGRFAFGRTLQHSHELIDGMEIERGNSDPQEAIVY